MEIFLGSAIEMAEYSAISNNTDSVYLSVSFCISSSVSKAYHETRITGARWLRRYRVCGFRNYSACFNNLMSNGEHTKWYIRVALQSLKFRCLESSEGIRRGDLQWREMLKYPPYTWFQMHSEWIRFAVLPMASLPTARKRSSIPTFTLATNCLLPVMATCTYLTFRLRHISHFA